MGLDGAQDYADQVLDQAHRALDASGLAHTDTLHALADWVGRRVPDFRTHRCAANPTSP